MIKAVLFDLDGTLLDRERSLQYFLGAQHDRLSALQHIPKEQFASRFTGLDANGSVWKDIVYQKLVAEFGIAGIQWQGLLEDYEKEFCRSCVPFPGLIPTLATLQEAGFFMGVISNGRSSFQQCDLRAGH